MPVSEIKNEYLSEKEENSRTLYRYFSVLGRYRPAVLTSHLVIWLRRR
jgi:hypothetical protein